MKSVAACLFSPHNEVTISASFMPQDCIFCKIAAGALPSNMVYKDDYVMVIHDIHPKAKVHLLVISKKHISSVSEVNEDHEKLLGHMIHVASKVAKEHGLEGYKLLFNVNREGGQVVFHIHLHVLGGGPIKLHEC
jgi:histidine triad (HIT) family protein